MAPARAENLSQAFDQALLVDGRLKASERQEVAAEATVDAAHGASLPTVSLDAAYNHWSQAPAFNVAVPQLGSSLQMPFAEQNAGVYRAGVSVPLYTGGYLSSTQEAAQAALEAARSDTVRTRQDLKLQVAQAYIHVLRARSALAVANSGVQMLSAHLNDVKAFREKGLVAANDLLAAQAACDNAIQDRIRAVTAVKLAESVYNRWMGRPLPAPVDIDEIVVSPGELSPGVLGAGQTRAELAALSQQAAALRAQAAAAQAQGLPQVALSAGYNRVDNRYLEREGLWNVAVGVHWSVFDGGVHSRQADALSARADAVAAQRADAQSQIDLQVRAAELSVDEASSRIEAAQSAATQSDENLRVARDRYQSGVGTNTEVLDAETLRERSHTNLSMARYDYVLAVQQLKRAHDAL